MGWADVATRHDLQELERRLDHRFEALETRFEARFEAIDHRFEAVDHRFEAVEQRFEDRFEAGAHRTDAAINRLAAELRAEMVAQTRALFLGVAAMTFTVAGLSFVAARAGG